MPRRLVEQTHHLFRHRSRIHTMAKIAQATGLKLGWLSEFSKLKIQTYDCDKIQTLYEYLTNDTDRLNFE